MDTKDKHLLYGLAAVFFYIIHAGYLIIVGEHYHCIWSCHLGCLLVGAGLVLKSPHIFSMGFFWLFLGVPLWILNVITSREFMVTSTLSHLGGLTIGLCSLSFMKVPRYFWIMATAGLLILGLFSRLVTPEHANVNLAFRVWAGWENLFPSYFWYVVMLVAISASVFFLLERTIEKLASPT